MFVFKVPCAVPVRFWLEGTWAVAVVLPPKEGTNSGTLGLRLGFSAVAAVAQVWSLTQFYSVDFSQLRISVKKCVFNKRTISRFASVVVDGVLGPPCLA